MSSLKIRKEELAENPTTRLPICLVLDTSYSMEGEPITELNEGVKIFMEELLNHEIAKYSAEVAVITFGNTAFSKPGDRDPKSGVKKILDFGSIEKQKIPTLTSGGYTPMGEAVELALEMLSDVKDLYRTQGVEYYQPWVVLMTDGKPYDGRSNNFQSVDAISVKTCELINNKKLTIFPIGITSPDLSLDILKRFSPKFDPLRLKGLKFKEFFVWLSQSVAKASESLPGEKINLDMEEAKKWTVDLG
jgi:uncharacterized protein YegL